MAAEGRGPVLHATAGIGIVVNGRNFGPHAKRFRPKFG